MTPTTHIHHSHATLATRPTCAGIDGRHQPESPADIGGIRRIAQEAAEWLVQLEEGNPDGRQFSAWLMRSPIHIREFLLVKAAYTNLESLHQMPSLSLVKSEAEGQEIDTNVVPFCSGPTRASPFPSNEHTRDARGNAIRLSPVVILAASAVFLCVIASCFLMFLRSTELSVEHVTGVGETKAVQFGREGLIELNTDSRVSVRVAKNEHQAILVSGEAVFRLPNAAGERVRIRMADATIDGANTEIWILEYHDRHVVGVIRGVANITRREPPDQGHVRHVLTRVTANHEATLWRTHGSISIRAVEPNSFRHRLAWRNGVLLFNGESLAEAVAEFNRYNSVKIIIGDAHVASLRIGGAFKATDSEAFARAATVLLGVSATRVPAARGNADVILIAPTGAKLAVRQEQA